MTEDSLNSITPPGSIPDAVAPTAPDWLASVHQQTPARIFVGRAGVGYHTRTQLELRRDHAAALDAVHAELEIERDFGTSFVAEWQLFTVQSQASSKSQYLMRPDLGRRLDLASRDTLQSSCPDQADLQIVIGDGLSAAAVIEQVPRLLPRIISEARERGWKVGQPFVVRYCRVGILNDIGELLDPEVVVLLIGERPGLATAQSLSAYFAYRPRSGDTDARRNLISNIHQRGLQPEQAVPRIMALVEQLRTAKRSGFDVREELAGFSESNLSFPEPPAENRP
ncbi:MAG: ethanolamine ammonia-lyase subunit EutC [Planctomycetaceae bacterium]|nr:ethanolamine ammonia-lyase subunit EutC [Planctomycetaceae bacterium]